MIPRAVPAPPKSPLAEVILQCAAAKGSRTKARNVTERYIFCRKKISSSTLEKSYEGRITKGVY